MVIKTESYSKLSSVQTNNQPVNAVNLQSDVFGIQGTTKYTPIITDYINSAQLNTQLYETFTLGTGSITPQKTQIMDLDISTGIGDYALVRNKKPMKFRNGYTYIVRGAIQFDSNGLGIANHLQGFEAGLAGNSISLGYDGNGAFFSHAAGGRNEVRVLKITTPSTGTENATVVLNGVNFTVGLTTSTGASGTAIGFTCYQISVFSYAGWEAVQLDDVVIFASTGLGPKDGTFSFSSSTAVGTFTRMNAGADKRDTKVYSPNWNGDTRLVKYYDPFKMVHYEIKYSSTNANFIVLSGYDAGVSKFQPLHTFNLSQEPSNQTFESMDFYIQRYIASLGSSTALTLKSLGVSSGYFGDGRNYMVSRSENVTKNITANVRENITVLRHLRFQNGMVISNDVILNSLSIATDGTKNVSVKLSIIDVSNTLGTGSLTDYPEYTSVSPSSDNAIISPQSIFIYDENSVSYSTTNENVLFQVSLAKVDSILMDLSNLDISIGRSDELVISALSTGSSTVSLSLGVWEDI